MRKGRYTNEKCDFLGYEFRLRRSKSRTGKVFLNFSPAISTTAAKAIRNTIRSWKLPTRSDKAIEDLSPLYHPIIRGWLQLLWVALPHGPPFDRANWTESWSFGPSVNTKTRMGSARRLWT